MFFDFTVNQNKTQLNNTFCVHLLWMGGGGVQLDKDNIHSKVKFSVPLRISK